MPAPSQKVLPQPAFSDDEVLWVLRARADGLSFGMIGAHLGASRSAVSGLLRRLGEAAAACPVDMLSGRALLAILDGLKAGRSAALIGEGLGLHRYAVLSAAFAVQVEADAAEGGGA